MVALSAALIAALLAVAKLIADKETKISDFRKDWINSFRGALAEMLGEAYSISGRIRIRISHAIAAKALESELAAANAANAPDDGAAKPDAGACLKQDDPAAADNTGQSERPSVGGEGEKPELPSDSIDPKLLTPAEIKELEDELTDHWNTLRKAHRTVLLHLNFSETVWGGRPYQQAASPPQKAEAAWASLVTSSNLPAGLAVTAQYNAAQNGTPSDAAVLLVAQLDHLVRHLLGKYYEVGTESRHEAIKLAIDNSTLLGNLVLKPEWNRIKVGEAKYNRLLSFLGGVGVVVLTVLMVSVIVPRKPVEVPPTHQIVIDMGASDAEQAPMADTPAIEDLPVKGDRRLGPYFKNGEGPR